MPAVLLGDAEGAGKLPSVHRRGADIGRFARLDDIMQRFERLLDRRVMVETVDLIEVDIIRAEPTQAVVDLGKDCLTTQPGAIGAGTYPAINLGAMTTSSRRAKSLIARPRISSLLPSE
jgi:hypothetical protein